jgi:hypothetical protein
MQARSRRRRPCLHRRRRQRRSRRAMSSRRRRSVTARLMPQRGRWEPTSNLAHAWFDLRLRPTSRTKRRKGRARLDRAAGCARMNRTGSAGALGLRSAGLQPRVAAATAIRAAARRRGRRREVVAAHFTGGTVGGLIARTTSTARGRARRGARLAGLRSVCQSATERRRQIARRRTAADGDRRRAVHDAACATICDASIAGRSVLSRDGSRIGRPIRRHSFTRCIEGTGGVDGRLAARVHRGLHGGRGERLSTSEERSRDDPRVPGHAPIEGDGNGSDAEISCFCLDGSCNLSRPARLCPACGVA